MHRSWILVVALAGCEPDFPSVDVGVTASRSGAAVKGAVVAVACPMPALGGAARTDAHGVAHVVVDLDDVVPCAVTVSHPDFATEQRFAVDLCPADATCDQLEVVLDEVVALGEAMSVVDHGAESTR